MTAKAKAEMMKAFEQGQKQKAQQEAAKAKALEFTQPAWKL